MGASQEGPGGYDHRRPDGDSDTQREAGHAAQGGDLERMGTLTGRWREAFAPQPMACLLYTSDAADGLTPVWIRCLGFIEKKEDEIVRTT